MITCEFIEEDFISAMNAVLSHIPHKRLRIDRISQIKESECGYDGTINLKNIIYLQFKRSDYYPINSKGRIRDERELYGFSQDKDFYSFNLLRSDDTSNYYKQHNCLWRLGQIHDAYYCAPLFYKKSELEQFNFTFFNKVPSEKNIYIDQNLRYNAKFMLENTICIKPHKEIKDFQYHRYTYDKTNNVVFHSNPEKIIKSSFRFSDKIDVLLNADKEIDLARMLINLVEIFKGYKKDVDNIFSNYLSYYEIDIKKIKEKKDIVKLGIIMEFYLKDNHNILQYGIFNKT